MRIIAELAILQGDVITPVTEARGDAPFTESELIDVTLVVITAPQVMTITLLPTGLPAAVLRYLSEAKHGENLRRHANSPR